MSTSYVAVYRGESVSAARLIAVSADPELVAAVSARILRADPDDPDLDPIVAPIDRAQRRALRLVRQEAERDRGA